MFVASKTGGGNVRGGKCPRRNVRHSGAGLSAGNSAAADDGNHGYKQARSVGRSVGRCAVRD